MAQLIKTTAACFLALLLYSCRTSQKTTSVVSETLSSESSSASRVSENSLSQILSTLSLQADSIVVWMQSGNAAAVSTLPSKSDSIARPSLHSMSKTSTAQHTFTPPKDKPQVAKILISGVKANTQSIKQHHTTKSEQDTVTQKVSSNSSQHIERQTAPRTRIRVHMIIVLLTLILAILAACLKAHLRK